MKQGNEVYKSHSKALRALIAAGMLEPIDETIPGRFMMKVKGYRLTLRGNFIYCTSC